MSDKACCMVIDTTNVARAGALAAVKATASAAAAENILDIS